MKRLFFTITLIAIIQLSSHSQQFKYCQIVGTEKFLNPGKVLIQIDNGQERGDFGFMGYLKDPETGKNRSFNSMIHALNFMSEHGWEFVQAYAFTSANNNVYHCVLKKPKNQDDDK
jgi:hypothetical protein